jgi:hypothetical protein
MKCDIPTAKGTVWGHKELVEWIGGTSFRISQGEVPKTSHQDSRYREL